MQRVHTFHLVHDLSLIEMSDFMHLCIRKSSLDKAPHKEST